MTPHHDPVSDAISRGAETAAALIKHRVEVFPHAHVILMIAGEDGLRACLAGVAESAIIAARRAALGLPPISEGEVLPFPAKMGEGGV